MTTDPWPGEQPTMSLDGANLHAKGLRTRNSLLQAAEEVFAESGWEVASIVKITERAGVSQGTFYRYFPSKRAIFDELIDDLNRRVRRSMAEGSAGARSRAEAERGGFEGFFRFTSEHPALYRIIRQAEFASPEAMHRHYERISIGYREALEAAMEAGQIAAGDPEVLAYALMGVGELIGMRWILWSDTQPADGTAPSIPPHVLDEVSRFVARGLGIAE